MRKIEDYENKMIHNGKRNERFVLIPCDYCGEGVWKKWHSRIRNGDPQYCNKECFDAWQRYKSEKAQEKENVNFYWDRKRWIARWRENGKVKSTTKAKWLWEKYNGKVPKNWVVTYIDENPENCELDNLRLMARGERTSMVMMGHTHSETAKRKMSESHKGKKLSKEHKKKISQWTKSRWEDGTFGSEEHLKKLSNSLKGKNNPNYIDGRSIKPYSRDFYNMRLDIRERDGNMCKACDRKIKGLQGHIHHVDGDKLNNDPYNLVLLCATCHRRVHNDSEKMNPMILIFRSMLKY